MAATYYNLSNIRTLLTEGFNAEELRRFCYDSPNFRPVYDELAENTGKGAIIDRLLEYSERKDLLDLLLTWAKKQNPSRFAKYQPYHTTYPEEWERAKPARIRGHSFPFLVVSWVAGGLVVMLMVIWLLGYIREPVTIEPTLTAVAIKPTPISTFIPVSISTPTNSHTSISKIDSEDPKIITLTPIPTIPSKTPTNVPTPTATPTTPPTTTPTLPSTGIRLTGKLAFTSDRGGQGYRIFVTDLSNGDITQVTDGANRDSLPIDDWDPFWSPNGDRIVFESGREGDFDIFSISLATKELHRLTTDSARNLVPVWSPNGDLIAFQSVRSGNFEIYVMSPDGSNLRTLTNHKDADLWPGWSPDEQQIVFEAQRTGNGKSGLYIMNVSSGDVRPFLVDDWNNGQPTWSKSGKIAFCSDRDGNKEIYTINQDGTELKRITSHEAEDWFPAWSPDDQWIVFTSSRNGNLEIYVTDLTGQHLQRITNNIAQDRDAAWFGN